jgi:hypothetical protein
MTGPLPAPAFTGALRAERDVFNQKFAEARRRRPDLDPGAFAEFLRGPVAWVVESAARAAPDSAIPVAQAAYDAALTLVSERLAGPGGRHSVIDAMWSRLLPELAATVAEQPARVIGSLTNAVFNLATSPGARPEQWIERLVDAAPSLTSVDVLLHAGQLAAWRAGLAHLRSGALSVADQLPPGVAARLLGAPNLEWSAARERLSQDPWWDPAAAPETPGVRVAALVGAFRGFGGAFLEPPTVLAAEGGFVASSAGESFRLCADVFGATFHRTEGPFAARPLRDLAFTADRVILLGRALPVPAIGAITSAAFADNTVAVTGNLSHSIALIALH